MHVTRWGRKEKALSEFPGWGLEIMIGLYGENQVREVLAAERAPARRGELDAADAPAGSDADRSIAQPVTGPTADLAAANGFVGFLSRFRRH